MLVLLGDLVVSLFLSDMCVSFMCFFAVREKVSTRLQFVEHSRVSRGHSSTFSMQSEEGGLLVPELSRVTAGNNERLEASAGLIG